MNNTLRFNVFCSRSSVPDNKLLSIFDTDQMYCSAHILSGNIIESLEYYRTFNNKTSSAMMHEMHIIILKNEQLSDKEQVNDTIKLLVMKLFYDYPLVFCIKQCQGVIVVRFAISDFSPFVPECISDVYADEKMLEATVKEQITKIL